MALDAELMSMKAAGTHRFERDLSTISNDTALISNLRLVVGFSKIGPFNTVNLVSSVAEFKKLYGDIDRTLEAKKSFFHRSAIVALSAGPILCLNLLSLDPDLDQVQTKSFSTNICDKNNTSITLPLIGMYNTDKFWKANPESFLDTINNYLVDDKTNGGVTENWGNNLLHFTNIGRKPVSILVKKANDYICKNYDITLAEWYGEGNVPEYLNPSSYASDYLVEVYVVSGDFGPSLTKRDVFTNMNLDDDLGDDGNANFEKLTAFEIEDTDNPYSRLCSDITYNKFFDKDGFIRRANTSEAMDSNLDRFFRLPSVNLLAHYTGSLIPNFVDKLGKNIWIQKVINDDVNTVGVLCAENTALLEVSDEELEHEIFNEKIDIVGHNIYRNVVLGISRENSNPNMNIDTLSYKMNYNNVYQQFTVEDEDGSEIITKTYIRPQDAIFDTDELGNPHMFGWINIDNPDDIVYTDNRYIESYSTCIYGSPDAGAPLYEYVKTFTKVNPLFSEIKRLNATEDEKDNEVYVSFEAKIKKGDYIVSEFGNGYCDEHGLENEYSRLTRVEKVVKTSKGLHITCASKIFKKHGVKNDIIVKITPIDKVCEHLQWVSLSGFRIRKDSMPNGTNERQNDILDMIRENPKNPNTISNLYKTLIDRDYIHWRYLVDTFGLGLEESCKDVYTLLCQGRKSALALVNCPSQMDFKKSQSPSFVNKAGSVSVEYIAQGGNLDKNPTFLYSLPDVENGASWGAYFYPYLQITDLGADTFVPPSAYVSNLYIKKYDRANAWSIVAGQKRGVIYGNQVTGVEATLIMDNRSYLEPMGINPIIWERGIGVEIYANKTAKQTPVSALSSAHVREACIYIQDRVEAILKSYVFEKNDAQTRLEIKTLVDDMLETVKNNGGIYDYKTTMDTSNNTPEVIDNNIGVIDIAIEPVRGLEKLAQRLTVCKTGGITSGSFD